MQYELYLFDGDAENEKLFFDYAGCNGSRVNPFRKPWKIDDKRPVNQHSPHTHLFYQKVTRNVLKRDDPFARGALLFLFCWPRAPKSRGRTNTHTTKRNRVPTCFKHDLISYIILVFFFEDDLETQHCCFLHSSQTEPQLLEWSRNPSWELSGPPCGGPQKRGGGGEYRWDARRAIGRANSKLLAHVPSPLPMLRVPQLMNRMPFA